MSLQNNPLNRQTGDDTLPLESTPATHRQTRHNTVGFGILVEFVGAAGVGKSFLLDELARELTKRQVHVRNLDQYSLKGTEIFRLCRAIWSASWVTVQISPNRLRDYPRVLRKLVRDAVLSQLPVQAGGICLRSEGVFHQLRQLTRMSRIKGMESVASRVIPMVKPPDLVVVLEAPARKIFEQRRKRSRFGDTFSLESVESDVQMTAESIQTIEFARREWCPEMQIVYCDLDRLAPKDACEVILSHIDAIMRKFQRGRWISIGDGT